MSWQAAIARWQTRRVFNALRSADRFDVARARDVFSRAMSQIPKPGRSATVTPVSAKGVRGEWVRTGREETGDVLYYLHGGGYFWGSPVPYRNLTHRLSKASRRPVFALDYRRAPEHPYPAALDDAVAGYDWLLEQGVAPRDIVIGGDSAGGGLTLATLLWLRDHKPPLPAAAFVVSPWTDLTATGESVEENAGADPMFTPDILRHAAKVYPAGADPADPYISPLFGDPTDLPPTLIQVSSTELLLDDARRMAEKMHDTGVQVRLDIWPNLPHVWHVLAFFVPEGRRAINVIGRFLDPSSTQ